MNLKAWASPKWQALPGILFGTLKSKSAKKNMDFDTFHYFFKMVITLKEQNVKISKLILRLGPHQNDGRCLEYCLVPLKANPSRKTWILTFPIIFPKLWLPSKSKMTRFSNELWSFGLTKWQALSKILLGTFKSKSWRENKISDIFEYFFPTVRVVSGGL